MKLRKSLWMRLIISCVILYGGRPCDALHSQVSTRRRWLQTATTSFVLLSSPTTAHAGEVGAQITKAVTQSDLGIAVRRSVVQGAQTMDRLDGKWEQFSDRFQLGKERSQRPDRPKPLVIPAPLPLDPTLAPRVLKCSDEIFLELMRPFLTSTQLTQQIQIVQNTVKPAFVRSASYSPENPAQQFNFDLYVHYKAYSDLLIQLDNKSNKAFKFPDFLKQYQIRMGIEVLQLLQLPVPVQESSLEDKLKALDRFGTALVQTGWVAQVDHARPTLEQIQDWRDDADDLIWTLALNGDITLGSQLLLQEQGFRLYSNLGKWAVQSILGPSSTVDDYYMDTDYNSDPDRFEVKQVLLNIQLEG
ncbi:hypothetical protein FisN_35Lh044 [Fistulifera solaris]|uniref:Uncharacterized protein n=1 Tax=Fistulifera solaris TaxID=1519565 RepID=A0A1Z5KQH6_FISSO|nr:hypothetical protein FisN_35Lh044 [Fistulifera solaris]|eukprot:GAX28188.1 hypothetical protein FisN_35Lh044 [Fistulifera solaris]